MSNLEAQFERAMFEIYQRAKSGAKYNATIFLQMVTTRGGIDTARYLINQPKPSDGYTHLYERGRLDLTVRRWLSITASGTHCSRLRKLKEHESAWINMDI
jgi:hypothetical protein